MAGLRNKHADMEIGYVNIGTQKKLYVQVGHERQYYGTLMSAKADKFLRMLEKWDEAVAEMMEEKHRRKQNGNHEREIHGTDKD